MEERDVIKEKLKVELEKLKMTVTIAVLLTGGLVSVLYKLYNKAEVSLNIVVFIMGTVLEIICIWYLLAINRNIKTLIKELGGTK